MLLIPAIDIKDNKCVRLLRGDYSTAHQVAEDAVEVAKSFRECGADWVHVVDLDGAKDAVPKNSELVFQIQKESGLKLEVGGGIRSMDTIDYYLSNGISRVILGSVAVDNPAFVREAVKKYDDRIVVGIDAKNGMVAQNGWLKTSNVNYLDLAKEMEQTGVKYIIFTDINLDGTLSGPNLDMLDELNNTVSCNVIASGGVANMKDIVNLLDLGIYGAICGKAIYSGSLNLQSAIRFCNGRAKNGT
jgi:phosphoribosylformimino-5-aminoimidazole carboxamide ribotide isomerase